MIFGTPRFLAPEQVLGEPSVDHRADIYSAGMILYMLLAGRDPFHRHREIFDVLTAQVTETPEPPSRLAQQPVPKALDDVVMRALAKRPEARFPDAAAFGVALGAALTSRPVRVETERRRWPETERVDLSAFQAPSPTATIARATARDFAADDRTVATARLAVPTAPLAVPPAQLTMPPARLAVPPAPLTVAPAPLAVPTAFAFFQPPRMPTEHDARARPALDEPAATASAAASRPARATHAGVALLIVIALLQLAIVWRLLHG
jgi:serine/threonine-protein kinase